MKRFQLQLEQLCLIAEALVSYVEFFFASNKGCRTRPSFIKFDYDK